MATYITITGDTFELIARKSYGTEQEAGRISRANPGAVEPFAAGIELYIPPIPDAPTDQPQNAQVSRPDEVAVTIDGNRFRFWQSVRITRSIDAMDTVEFSAPFEPDAPGFKEAFRPFSYKSTTVLVNGEPLFTGTMVSVTPDLGNSQGTLSISGYSLPGVLNDCTFPASAYPIEYIDTTLKEIANIAAGTFGLSVEFDADAGPTFDFVAAEPSQKVLAFLSTLAKQRNFIITSTPAGSLRFLRSVNVGRPVGVLSQGISPVLSISPAFNPQNYYSHVTGLVPVIVGLDGTQFTVKNPHKMDALRPLAFNTEDLPDAEVQAAVNAKIGRMFGDAASYSVNVATWRDPAGNLWEPNTTVKLIAPRVMIYSEYEFLIRSVVFNRDRASETATLSLVLPGAYSGEIPEALPWD